MNEKETQKQWILRYIDKFGSVTPSKMGGKVWEGKIWPACGMRRCQELEKLGILEQVKIGGRSKFERKVERITLFNPKIQVQEKVFAINGQLFKVKQ